VDLDALSRVDAAAMQQRLAAREASSSNWRGSATSAPFKPGAPPPLLRCCCAGAAACARLLGTLPAARRGTARPHDGWPGHSAGGRKRAPPEGARCLALPAGCHTVSYAPSRHTRAALRLPGELADGAAPSPSPLLPPPAGGQTWEGRTAASAAAAAEAERGDWTRCLRPGAKLPRICASGLPHGLFGSWAEPCGSEEGAPAGGGCARGWRAGRVRLGCIRAAAARRRGLPPWPGAAGGQLRGWWWRQVCRRWVAPWPVSSCRPAAAAPAAGMLATCWQAGQPARVLALSKRPGRRQVPSAPLPTCPLPGCCRGRQRQQRARRPHRGAAAGPEGGGGAASAGGSPALQRAAAAAAAAGGGGGWRARHLPGAVDAGRRGPAARRGGVGWWWGGGGGLQTACQQPALVWRAQSRGYGAVGGASTGQGDAGFDPHTCAAGHRGGRDLRRASHPCCGSGGSHAWRGRGRG
jgi:hypothetical protein